MNDEELGAALGDALRAQVSGIEPSPALLEWIERKTTRPVAEDRSTRARRSRLRIFAAMPVAAAAIIVAAIIALSGPARSAPAYAVTLDPNGSIVVSIYDITGVSGVNARLRALHAPVVVIHMSASCPTHVNNLTGILDKEHPAVRGVRITRTPQAANTTVLLAAMQYGTNEVEMALGRIKGPLPSCVSSKGVTGPGLPGWKLRHPIRTSKRGSNR